MKEKEVKIPLGQKRGGRVWFKLNASFDNKLHLPSKSRITDVEATVVLKLNQGTIPQSGCNRLWGSFFVSFLEKQKRKIEIKKHFISTPAGQKAGLRQQRRNLFH
ncbi:MAG TPA: hypothetical protein PKJ94_11850, partial [Ferruginibacter sp.]|nr:hypothetical protein [Ferruginibacter sp.]